MIEAIKLLRETADDCERRAKEADDKAARAEVLDICARWLVGRRDGPPV